MGRRSRRRDSDRSAALRRFWRTLVIVVVAAASAAIAVLVLRAADASREVQSVAVFFVVGVALLLVIHGVLTETTEPIGILGAAVAITLGVIGALNYLQIIEPDPAVGCLNSHGAIRASAAADKTIVYSKATPLSDPQALLLPGCALKFTGYCIGAVHGDATQGEDVREARWLILDDHQGLVAAGDTVGTIPADTQPSPCPGGLEPPGQPMFSGVVADAQEGVAELDARADRAAYVGFAIEQPNRRSQRLGWDRLPADDDPVVLPVPPGTRTGARVAAATCVGVQRPVGKPVIRPLRSGSLAAPKDLPIVRQPTYSNPGLAACDAGLPEPGTG